MQLLKDERFRTDRTKWPEPPHINFALSVKWGH